MVYISEHNIIAIKFKQVNDLGSECFSLRLSIKSMDFNNIINETEITLFSKHPELLNKFANLKSNIKNSN